MESTTKKTILGLDISTTTIGISLVVADENGEIIPIEVTHLRLKVPKSTPHARELFLKTDLFLEKLRELNSNYIINEVVIEDPLISSNNAITASVLMRFNGMISLMIHEVLGVYPNYISSYDARKYGMPQIMAVRKFNKKGSVYPSHTILKSIKENTLVAFGSYPFDCAKKEIVWNYISERFPKIEWVFDKNNELKKENFDASDSLLCILGYLNKTKYDGQEPQIIKSETPDKTTIKYTVEFCGQQWNKTILLNAPKA